MDPVWLALRAGLLAIVFLTPLAVWLAPEPELWRVLYLCAANTVIVWQALDASYVTGRVDATEELLRKRGGP